MPRRDTEIGDPVHAGQQAVRIRGVGGIGDRARRESLGEADARFGELSMAGVRSFIAVAVHVVARRCRPSPDTRLEGRLWGCRCNRGDAQKRGRCHSQDRLHRVLAASHSGERRLYRPSVDGLPHRHASVPSGSLPDC